LKQQIGRVLTRLFLLFVLLSGASVVAQQPQQFDDLKSPAAKESLAKLRTEPGIYQFLSGLALESFKNGDHVRAVQVGRVIEYFWDNSETTRDIRANLPETYKGIDSAMDVFISALAKPKTDGSANSNAEAAYSSYIAKLQLKPLSGLLSETIRDKGMDAALQQFQSLRAQGFPGILVTEADTNNLGYALLSKGEKGSAIKIFQLNVDMYPKSANVYDSLSEAYAANEQKDLAIENYRKALSVDPQFESSIKALRKLTQQQ
jgi:tetratricopeptide (TPR) repeat protein